MVNGQRSRLPAHWKGISPVLGVFVSSGEGEMQFPQNPQWICLKAKCVEGGLEEFEDYWNRPPDRPKPPEPLYSAGVQGVQPQNSENQGVDSLKSLYSEGVQGGSTVQSESFGVDSKLNDASPQAENDSLRVKTLGGQNGQGGQVDVEPVSAVPANLDRVDRVDNSTLLPQDAVQRAVDQMAAIDSVESFQQFYDLYHRCSQIQQQQVMDAFTTQVDNEQQIRFYQCWQQFEAPELTIEPELTQASAQEPGKSAGRNQWVYARLSQSGGETLVRVLTEKLDSITVHVPGSGSKSVKPSEVIRVSPYTGD
jgi:putative DNA primase/helicase